MGVNDITIIGTIIFIFVIIGAALPFINEAFGIPPEETSCFDIIGLEKDIGNTTTELGEKTGVTATVGSLGIVSVLASITKMFFWTCGALPIVIDLFFLVIRIILVVVIARNIWVGGGG